MDRALTLDGWIDRFTVAWETADTDLVASLFTSDVTYRSSPFREAMQGHEQIRAYWHSAARMQSNVHVRMGTPFVDRDHARVAIEWWATMTDDGDPLTLSGCLLLRFARDGRCTALREYWHAEAAQREPFPGWANLAADPPTIATGKRRRNLGD